MDEILLTASTTTYYRYALADVAGSETKPDATPGNYRELMDLLKRYCFVPQRMFGARCNHFQEVHAITRILGRKRREFEGITVCQVSTVLWHIFMDTRHSFTTMVDVSGSLPSESNLRVARGMIETTIIPEQVNVPYEQLLRGVDEGVGNGGTEAGGQDSFEPARAPSTADAPVGQRNFNRVPGPIKTALVAGARTKYPALRVLADLTVAATPLLRYTAVKIGSTGACLDMHALSGILQRRRMHLQTSGR
jgi:hypothetical protein